MATQPTSATKTGSQTATMLPLIACLNRAEEFLGEKPPWVAVNDLQQRFLQNVLTPGREEALRIPETELRSIAAKSAEAINDFLAAQGFSISLQPFQDQNSFGLAAVQRSPVKWATPGRQLSLRTTSGETVPGVMMKHGLQVMSSPAHSNPVAQITCQGDEQVFMTVADTIYEGLDLLDRVNDIEQQLSPCPQYKGAHFPMVNLDQEVSIGWLLNLSCVVDKVEWFIRQAVQQTKFRMNHLGALTESAAAAEVASRGMSAPPLIIDQPFFLWKKRPGVNTPLFVGYLDKDCWADPGDLEL